MIDPYRFPDDGPIRFRRERDLGDVINAAVRFCRETWREWLPSLVLIAGPLYIIGGVLESISTGWGALASAVAGLLAGAGAFGYIRLYREGVEAVETADVWDEAKALFWPTLSFALWCIGALMLAVFPIVLLIGLSVAGGGVVAAGVVGVVLLIALFALIVFLLPYYLTGQASRLLDEDSFSDAIGRVRGLIREERGLATGTAIVLLFVVGFGSAAVGGTVSALALSSLDADGTIPLWAGVLSGVASIVVLPFGVFYYVASAFLYESLSARVEGTEVGEGIEAIAAATGLGGSAPVRSTPPRPVGDRDDRPADAAGDRSEGEAGGFRGGGFGGRSA